MTKKQVKNNEPTSVFSRWSHIFFPTDVPWTDRDGVSYQLVFPPNRDYEVLQRNGKPVLDFEKECAAFNKSVDGGSLNIGNIEPFRNFCIVGTNFDGSPFFDARIFDFVTKTFLPETIRQTSEYEWLEDGLSFIYVVVEPERNWPFVAKLHRLGQHAIDDIVM